jgi:hypothetical protein
MEHSGKAGGVQVIEKIGAGDGVRTRDVQLGKMGNVLFSVT